MDIDIHSAIKFNNIAAFKYAVERDDYSLDARNESGDTVLHTACDFQNAGMVEIILWKRPTMVSSRNNYGETPMHAACKNGNLQILHMLMESDPEVATQVDHLGHTPLMVSIYGHNHYHLVEYLLQYPWMPGSDESGTRCLHIAILKLPEDVKMVRLLVEAPPNLAMTMDKEGNTALHFAMSNNCSQVTEYLIKYTKVDVHARNKEGKTALDIYTTDVDPGYWRRDHELVENSTTQDFSPATEFPAEDSSRPTIKVPSHYQGDGTEEELPRGPRPTGNNVDFLEQRAAVREILERILGVLYEQKSKEKGKFYEEGLQNARNTVVIVAVLIATVAFQASLSPPGGVHQDGAYIGKSVLATTMAFKVFTVTNTLGLSISLGIVITFVSFIPVDKKPLETMIKYSHRAMCMALFFMAIAFIAASWATLPSDPHTKWMRAVVMVVIVGGLMVMTLVWKHIKELKLKNIVAHDAPLGPLVR